MARIRTIKPEFWTNEELSETSEAARLLAIGLLNHSDDEGYFKAHASLIKAAVFPLTDPSVTIHECLNELSNASYIRLFRGSDGKQYGKVINFESHQVVNRPKPSKIKHLDDGSEESLINHAQVSDGSSQEGKGKEQGKEQGKDMSGKPDPVALEVLEFLNEKTGKSYKAKKTNLEHINARIAEGYALEEFKHVITVKVADWKGTDMEMYLRPTTLFNSKKFDGYVNQPLPQKRGSLPGDEQPGYKPGSQSHHSVEPF